MRWLVRVDLYRNVVDAVELRSGTDLRQALTEGIEQLQRDGWDIEGVSFSGTFVTRGAVRHYLSVVPTDPGEPVPEMYGVRNR
jgi:hypothetical protein